MGAHTLALLNVFSQLIQPSNPQRTLFSLSFALLVAIAEGVLFVLWDSRRLSSKGSPSRPRRSLRTQDADVKIKVE